MPCSSKPRSAARGLAADRDEQELGLDGLPALEGHHDAVVGDLGLLERGAGAAGDAALAEGALEGGGGRGVLAGDEPGERPDDGDLGAEAAPHAGELAADDLAADIDDRGRHAVQAQRVLGGEHAGSPSTSVPGRVRLYEPVARTTERPVEAVPSTVTSRGPVRRPAPSMTVMRAAGADQAGEALEQAADHAVLVGEHAGHVDALERGADAELRGLAEGVGDLGGVHSAFVGRSMYVPPSRSF